MDIAFEHGLGAAHRLCEQQTGCDGCTRYSAGLLSDGYMLYSRL